MRFPLPRAAPTFKLLPVTVSNKVDSAAVGFPPCFPTPVLRLGRPPLSRGPSFLGYLTQLLKHALGLSLAHPDTTWGWPLWAAVRGGHRPLRVRHPPMPVSGGPKWEVALLSRNNEDTDVLPIKFLLTVKNLKTHKNRRKVDQSSLPVQGVEKVPGSPVQRPCRRHSLVFPVGTEDRRETGTRK